MRTEKSTILIDVIGATAVISMVSWVAWYSFLKPDTATSQVNALAVAVEVSTSRLRDLEHGLDQQKSVHRGLFGQATDRENLPDEIPIEQTLADITALADRHGVRMIGVSPWSKVKYSGVLEIRYRLSAEGGFQNLLRFLKEFESEDYWADVTFLNLLPGGAGDEAESMRLAELTLSFFSAIPETPVDESS